MYKHITDVAPSLQHGDRVDVDGPYIYDEDVVFTASGCAGAGTITINGVPDGAGVQKQERLVQGRQLPVPKLRCDDYAVGQPEQPDRSQRGRARVHLAGGGQHHH